MSNEIKPNTYSDSRTDTWWGEQQKLQAELEKRGYPDPRTTTGWDYQAQIAGYENGEEFKKEYFKTAGKAAEVGIAEGMGLFAGAFGIASGSIVCGPKLAAVTGFVVRAGSRAIAVAKNVGVKAWNMAKSLTYRAAGMVISTPQGVQTIERAKECVEGLTPGTPAPDTVTSGACNFVKNIYDTLTDDSNEPITQKRD